MFSRRAYTLFDESAVLFMGAVEIVDIDLIAAAALGWVVPFLCAS